MVELIHGECLTEMARLPDASVDLILCDLPYGTTQNKWDSVIDFEAMWAQYRRVCKGAIVLTAAQPFTSALVMSNPKDFKYQWVWVKNMPTGALNAKHQPMRNTEDVLIFYRGKQTYNPQPTKSLITDRALGRSNGSYKAQTATSTNYGKHKTFEGTAFLKEEVNPRTAIEIACEPRALGSLHPTQKPVALMEYMIRTYTDEGMTVLDNCMGSGTTGVACVNTGRDFIGIEMDATYFAIAEKRIREAQDRMLAPRPAVQEGLFV